MLANVHDWLCRKLMCVTVTLVDGLVLARAQFHHSIHYRSVCVLGEGR
jgi:uncharacterized protein